MKIFILVLIPSELELSYELRNLSEILPESVRSRLEIIQQKESYPIRSVIRESKEADLTIARTSSIWGIERQTLQLN
jgi:hypothetical protein